MQRFQVEKGCKAHGIKKGQIGYLVAVVGGENKSAWLTLEFNGKKKSYWLRYVKHLYEKRILSMHNGNPLESIRIQFTERPVERK